MPNEDGVATAGPLSGMVVDPSAASTVESLTWSNISVELVGGGVGGLWIIVSVVLVASEDLAEISESFYPLTMALIGEEVEDIESILYIAREISGYYNFYKAERSSTGTSSLQDPSSQGQ